MKTILGNTPIDIAGFCNNAEVVMTFCKNLERNSECQNKVPFRRVSAAALLSRRARAFADDDQDSGRARGAPKCK